MRRTLLRGSALLLGGILLGMLLLAAAYALPVEPIRKHLEESLVCFDGSDDMPEADNETLIKTYPGTWLDVRTDLVMMQIAAYDSDASPWEQALENRMYNDMEHYFRLSDRLAAVAQGVGKDAEPAYSYGRYWHGYLLFLKPLLLFFNLSDIRMFNMMLQWTLCMMLMLLAYRKAGFRLVLPLGVSILALNPLSAALSFQYSSMYLLTLIACIVQLSLELYNKSHGWLLYLWLGILTAFFDFLTYPPAALGICLILGLVLKAGSAKEKLACAVGSGLAWGVGYAGMWSGKWLVGTLITGQNILADAMETAQYRAGSQSTAAEGGSSLSFGQVLLKNLGVYCNAAGLLLLLALLMLLGCLIIRGGYRFQRGSGNLPALAAVALIPFAWYFVLRNHSGVHYWMTHRNLSISIMAITCLIGFSLDKNGGPDHG